MFGDRWKYRVGNYRIIASIEDRVLRVLVVRIGHRRDVYRGRQQRKRYMTRSCNLK